jgi:hypothetical protein
MLMCVVITMVGNFQTVTALRLDLKLGQIKIVN